MKNEFTEHLINHGWQETSPMVYNKTGSNYEIFFDNSNAIEIYMDGKRVRDAYLTDLSILINLLNTLK